MGEHMARAFSVVIVLIISVLSTTNAQSCRPSCQPPDCSCPRITYPMPTRDIPQMVYFGFDDAVNIVMSSLYERIFTKKRKNPNGCRMKMSLFVSHQYTDYRKVKKFYDNGNEIGVHSVTHTAIDNDEILRKEAKQQKDNLVKAGVPADEIVGWRSPFLKTAGNNQPQILKDLGYEYDISLTYTRPRMSTAKPWPFTMDHGWPYPCGVEPCPFGAQVDNFWAVPVVSLMDHKDSYPCPFVDGCAVPALNEPQAYDFLMKNFMSYYNTTRAPFGLNMHAAWFYRRHNLKAMMRFLDDLMKFPDVYVVTVRQMLDWMRQPTPMSEIDTLQSWQCTASRKGGHRKQPNIRKPSRAQRRGPINFLDLFRLPTTPRRKPEPRTTVGRWRRPLSQRAPPRRKVNRRKDTLRSTTTTTTTQRPTTTRPTTTQPTTTRPTTTRRTTTTTTTRPTTTRKTTTRSTTTRPTTTRPTTTRPTTTRPTTTRPTTTRPTTTRPTTTRPTTTQPTTTRPTTTQPTTTLPTTTRPTTTRPTTIRPTTTRPTTSLPTTTKPTTTRPTTTRPTTTTSRPTTTRPTTIRSTTTKPITTRPITTQPTTTRPTTTQPTTSRPTTTRPTTTRPTTTRPTTRLQITERSTTTTTPTTTTRQTTTTEPTTKSPTRTKSEAATLKQSDIHTMSKTRSKPRTTPPKSKKIFPINTRQETKQRNHKLNTLRNRDRTHNNKHVHRAARKPASVRKSMFNSSVGGRPSLLGTVNSFARDMFVDHIHGNNHKQGNRRTGLHRRRQKTRPIIKPSEILLKDYKYCVQGINCKLPSCFCQGEKIPKGLKLKDTPQMIFITLDGSVNHRLYRRYGQIFAGRTNPNNCRARGTIFATESGSTPTIIRRITQIGAEIAMSGMHEHHYDTVEHMEKELQQQKTSLKRSNVESKGWKTPELKAMGDDQYQLLQKHNILYDATLSMTLPRLRGMNQWPFTLDFGFQGNCVIPECPTEKFPGLWEVPSVPVRDYKKMYECAYVDGCMFNPPTANDTETFLWDNFMFNYKSNKAPFGLHLRQLWFSHQAYRPNIRGLKNFLDRIMALEDVFLVSTLDIIKWMQNPIPLNSITTNSPWNCS